MALCWSLHRHDSQNFQTHRSILEGLGSPKPTVHGIGLLICLLLFDLRPRILERPTPQQQVSNVGATMIPQDFGVYHSISIQGSTRGYLKLQLNLRVSRPAVESPTVESPT